MKKITLFIGTILLAISLLATGCSSGNSPTVLDPTPTPYVPTDGEPPVDRTWISPGKVQVGNFYPGGRAEWPITVHNGNDHVATFSVAFRYPDNVGDGYVKPTYQVQDWVIVADPTPVLAPYETREIMVTLNMPSNAQAPGSKWEFWISVKDTTQSGMVQTELCSRWLVSMR